MSNRIPVFYDDRMVYGNKKYSPSPWKPKLFVESLNYDRYRLRKFAKARPLDLIHSTEYVYGVIDGKIANGHGTRCKKSAQAILWTVGSILEATVHAMDYGIACSPTSGFHHAGYDNGHGFCTFNGLAAAALVGVENGLRVLILDCDWHYGDGTESLVKDCFFDDMVSNVCISGDSEKAYFDSLSSALGKVRRYDLVLYQAGADAHVDDPLGGVLTTGGMAFRDRIVFEACKKHSVPLVWNLAGGYQRDKDGGISKVIELHKNTFDQCWEVYCGL